MTGTARIALLYTLIAALATAANIGSQATVWPSTTAPKSTVSLAKSRLGGLKCPKMVSPQPATVATARNTQCGGLFTRTLLAWVRRAASPRPPAFARAAGEVVHSTAQAGHSAGQRIGRSRDLQRSRRAPAIRGSGAKARCGLM